MLLAKACLPGHLNFNLYADINADINVTSSLFLINQSSNPEVNYSQTGCVMKGRGDKHHSYIYRCAIIKLHLSQITQVNTDKCHLEGAIPTRPNWQLQKIS